MIDAARPVPGLPAVRVPSANHAATIALVYVYLADGAWYARSVPLRTVHELRRLDERETVDWDAVRSQLRRVQRSALVDEHLVSAWKILGAATATGIAVGAACSTAAHARRCTVVAPARRRDERLRRGAVAAALRHRVRRAVEAPRPLRGASTAATVVKALRSSPVTALAAAAQAMTVLVTWSLWNERTSPPNLPLVDALRPVPYALLLLLLATVAIVRPRVAAPLFGAVYVLAALGDQTRLQPEVISLTVLMIAPALRRLRPVDRALAPDDDVAVGRHAQGVEPRLDRRRRGFIADVLHVPGARTTIAVALPLCEIGLGAASLVRRAWPFVRWGGLVLHLGIFLTLSPPFANWNSSVWPWNIAVGVVVGAPVLHTSRLGRAGRGVARSHRRHGPVPRAVLRRGHRRVRVTQPVLEQHGGGRSSARRAAAPAGCSTRGLPSTCRCRQNHVCTDSCSTPCASPTPRSS